MDSIPICISGFSTGISENVIRSELLSTSTDGEIENLYIDKRKDGSTDQFCANFVKCYVTIKSSTPVKKLCAIIHKSPFSRSNNLTVKPLAIIPVAVVDICNKSGSNVIEYVPDTEEIKASDSKAQKRKSELVNEVESKVPLTKNLDESQVETNDDSSENCVFVVLTGFEDSTTEEEVKKLFGETNNDVKQIVLDRSSEKLKVFVKTQVAVGAGVKRFCAFLCKELTAKAGSKINVKHIEELPGNLRRSTGRSAHVRQDCTNENGAFSAGKEKHWGWKGNDGVAERGNSWKEDTQSRMREEENTSSFPDSRSFDREGGYRHRNADSWEDYRERNESWKKPRSYPVQPYKSIVYYDPKNPDHKCYELESDRSTSSTTGEVAELGEQNVENATDTEQTSNLKNAFSESGKECFSFGFGQDMDQENVATSEPQVNGPSDEVASESVAKPAPKVPHLLFALPSLEAMKSANFYNPKPNEEILSASKFSKKKHKMMNKSKRFFPPKNVEKQA